MSNTFQLRADGSLAEIAEDGTTVGVVAPMPQRTESTQAAPQKPTPKAKREAETLTPRDVVRAAKARAKQLRAEIRRLANAKRELEQMERLIAAADNRPTATVRELKRSAG